MSDYPADMGKRVNVSDLVDAAAIAERFGFSRPQTVHNWRARHADFPQPIATFGKAVIWNWPDVEAWAKRHRKPLAR